MSRNRFIRRRALSHSWRQGVHPEGDHLARGRENLERTLAAATVFGLASAGLVGLNLAAPTGARAEYALSGMEFLGATYHGAWVKQI
ncbi:hypothetical protein JT358_00370 [Micrococcales bacterium 31B]|nr:hypothetical protein [Micrococcales bacterium 31B]